MRTHWFANPGNCSIGGTHVKCSVLRIYRFTYHDNCSVGGTQVKCSVLRTRDLIDLQFTINEVVLELMINVVS